MTSGYSYAIPEDQHDCGPKLSSFARLMHRFALGSIIAILAGGAAFGIYAFVSYLTTPTPPLTMSESWHDGYGDALSDAGYTSFPWGPYSCVNDWNGNGGFGIDRAGYADGGPPYTRYLTLQDQNTHSRLGNAWMAGCRAGLRSMGKGY